MNPFQPGTDRGELWEMLVTRDIDAFLASDWSKVEGDFCAERFFAVDAGKQSNPDDWKLGFPTLDAYRDAWLEQAEEFADTQWDCDVRTALFSATDLSQIEIEGDAALLHKKFNGGLRKADGEEVVLLWQTLYHCRKLSGQWRIVGFTGYLPYSMKKTPLKSVPEGASQHVTAGPYSPVLVVDPGKLVVICGQAAIARDGSVIGDTIEEQTRATLENCKVQLESAGCSLADVFKANVYMPDLEEWPRFNSVYAEMMPDPRPVRTAVGTSLLPGLKVEVEMWAVKA